MRRLPVYFLIDVSESMVGEPIEQVQDGIASIIKELKTDPYALETVWISIIGFAGKSKVITPLQDIITFYPPKIPIGSGTSIANGLKELMKALDNDLVKTTYQRKGDWKPIIFLFTDGIPTDDSTSAIELWNSNYRAKSNLVIISIGDNTNLNLLSNLSDQVLLFNNTNANAYKDFFRWITASIKATSEKINNTSQEGINLSKTNDNIIEIVDTSKRFEIPDDNYVVLNGKCANNDKLYLIKFKRQFEDFGLMDLQSKFYKVEGAHKIDEVTYKEFSNQKDYILKISTDELRGNPSCPCCGNQYALATCICGGIHCIQDGVENTCPWCGNSGLYGSSESGFDINRTLG